MGLGIGDGVVEALGHDVVKTLVNLRLGPEVAHAVVNPLEVAGGAAAGFGENIGDDEDAFIGEYLIGDGGGGAVSAFAEDLAANAFGVLAGDDVFGSGGNEDFAVIGEQLVLVGGLGLGETGDGAGALAVLDKGVDVDPVLVVETAVILGDADDGVAL